MPRNINLIPRRSGDSVNPRVGARGVIAGKAVYSQKSDRFGMIVIIVMSDPNPSPCPSSIQLCPASQQRPCRALWILLF